MQQRQREQQLSEAYAHQLQQLRTTTDAQWAQVDRTVATLQRTVRESHRHTDTYIYPLLFIITMCLTLIVMFVCPQVEETRREVAQERLQRADAVAAVQRLVRACVCLCVRCFCFASSVMYVSAVRLHLIAYMCVCLSVCRLRKRAARAPTL